MRMKKGLKRFLCLLGAAVLLLAAGAFAKVKLWGRPSGERQAGPARVELSWDEAMADGAISDEEIAIHDAPEILAAVNVLLSDSGRGDFLAAVDFDGDMKGLNNWEHMPDYPLEAVVYYSVQETAENWFVGYYFYHPRDDAEIWLDCHENDMEGILIAVPRSKEGFLAPTIMYTQGHGKLPFYFDEGWSMSAGSRQGGGLALDGDRPMVYITPNGTLDSAGHSVESARDHSTYWAVGNSGILYYHGGEAQEPASFNGPYEQNPCSYALRSLDELWQQRKGPYTDETLFGEYGAFRGDNYEVNAANPPWGWRNKTDFGYGGSFLSDPAWTFSRAIGAVSLSSAYTRNPYADWLITVNGITAPAAETDVTLQLTRDGGAVSTPAWWTLTPAGDGAWTVSIADPDRQRLWAAAPEDTVWGLTVIRSDGTPVEGASADWSAVYLPDGYTATAPEVTGA